MSRSRRGHSSTLQLFPFLAVLVSALGALVLLLLAINRQVALQASAAARQALIDQTSEEETLLADRQRELELQIRSLRTRIERALTEDGQAQQTIMSRTRQLRNNADQSEQLQAELDRLRKARREVEQQISTIRQKIGDFRVAKAKLANTRRDPDQTFIPVVHPGANGSPRQPIYLECNGAAVVFQPEALALPAWLLKTEQGQSTLVHAVESLIKLHRERMELQRGSRDQGEIEPYPLLLVRPDGAAVFYAVRQAFELLQQEWGYELVEGDWTFQFPELDPNARALLAQCFELGRDRVARSNAPVAGSPRGSGRGASQGGHVALSPNLGQLLGLEPVGDSRHSHGQGAAGIPQGDQPPTAGASGVVRSDQGTASSGQSAASRDSAGWPSGQGMGNVGRDTAARPVGRASLGAGTLSEDRGDATRMPVAQKVQPRIARSQQPFERQPEADSNSTDSIGSDQPAQGVLAGSSEPVDANSAEAVGSAQQVSGTSGTKQIRWGEAESDDVSEITGLVVPASNGRISIARHVEIFCRSDSLRLANRQVYAGRPDVAILRRKLGAIAQGVQREVIKWGPPGMTFQWRPKLLCLVHSDGLEMYYGLRLALIGSSIEIDHVILAEDEPGWDETMFLHEVARASEVGHRFME
jgi:hypothetical protein